MNRSLEASVSVFLLLLGVASCERSKDPQKVSNPMLSASVRAAPSVTASVEPKERSCVAGKYVVPQFDGWNATVVATEECLARKLVPRGAQGQILLLVCLPIRESAFSSATEADPEVRISVRPDRECRMKGRLVARGGTLSGELELSFVVRNGGTDRVSLTVEDVDGALLEAFVRLVAGARFAPFGKADEDELTWQYYNAECQRNRRILGAHYTAPTLADVKEALTRLREAKQSSGRATP